MNWTSPGISLRKKKKNPALADAPTGAAGAPAATAALSAQDQLIQSALQAGIPLATIQQILISQPNLILGAPNPSATPTTPPSLLNPLITFNVQVQNLLNNTRVNGYGGVITSPLFGRATGWGQGRSITLSLQTRF
jgi:hypothetical protein